MLLYEVILDEGETPNKCTIAPLAERPDFRILRVRGARRLGPLHSKVLLHHEGECLSAVPAKSPESRGTAPVESIASIDCVWRRLEDLMRQIDGVLPMLKRIPDGFQTAYPRRSKKNADPAGGLATIEAIFTASALLGNWDHSLFSEYHFGREFVMLNRARFLELGVFEAGKDEALPVMAPRIRNSMQRRLSRGKW